MADSYVLLELANVPEDATQAWRAWYDGVYLPARVAVPGVRAGRRGAGIQNKEPQAIPDAPPADIGVFELESDAVVSSPEWAASERSITQSDGNWLERQREFTTTTVYRCLLSTQAEYLPPRVSLLHGAFYEMPSQYHDEFNDWYALEHIPIQMRVPGYLNARRFQGTQDPEMFVALYDVEDIEYTRTPEAKGAMESAWSDRMRDKLARKRARRLFDVQAREVGAGGRS